MFCQCSPAIQPSAGLVCCGIKNFDEMCRQILCVFRQRVLIYRRRFSQGGILVVNNIDIRSIDSHPASHLQQSPNKDLDEKQRGRTKTTTAMFEDPEFERARFLDLMAFMDHLTMALFGLFITVLSVTVARLVASSRFLPQRPLIQAGLQMLIIFIAFFVMTYGTFIWVTGVDSMLNIQRTTIASPTRRNITRSINIAFVWLALQSPRLTMDMYVCYILVLIYTTVCITEDY